MLNTSQPIDTLLDKMQAQLSLWKGLLRTTGGAIDPTKSDWVWIEQKWNNGQWRYEREIDTHFFRVKGLTGSVQALHQHDIKNSRETLGFVQSATADETGQKDALTKKITTWGNRLKALASRGEKLELQSAPQ